MSDLSNGVARSCRSRAGSRSTARRAASKARKPLTPIGRQLFLVEQRARYDQQPEFIDHRALGIAKYDD